MAITNHERVGKALELLNAGLKPFVERELKATYKDRWIETARPSFPDWQHTGKEGKGLRAGVLLKDVTGTSVKWDSGTTEQSNMSIRGGIGYVMDMVAVGADASMVHVRESVLAWAAASLTRTVRVCKPSDRGPA